ncbi:hypothetical protein CH063_08747, partial [Colletotrichum higginsianum]
HDLQYQILDFLKSHVDWLALPKDIQENRPAKMMDYACGNGIVTRVRNPFTLISPSGTLDMQ